MLRLLSDECFHGKIVRGLRRIRPDLDLVSVQEVGLTGSNDAKVLAWAAAEDRILLTHDRQTIPGIVRASIRAGDSMPGVFVIDNKKRIRDAIDSLLLADGASEQDEWRGEVVFLPF